MSDPSAAFFVAGAIPLILIGLTYEKGARRRATVERPVSTLRRAMFITGVVAFLLSIEWPFADWAHELFSVHQIGILIARIVAPILIVASRPAGLLIAGLPRPIRRSVLKPGLSHPAVRRAWPVIATPPAALSLYVATLYFWEVPALQADAIGEPAAGLAMHFSLLLTGLLFWSRVFERRPAPHAPAHGWRLMMILIAVLSQVLLGAYITVKSGIFYPAYAPGQHLAAVRAIIDEQTGGFLIWVPSSFLSLVALIVAIDRWGRHETKMDVKRRQWSPSNSAILLYPETAAALRAMVKTKNRRLAIGMIVFVALVFCAAFGSAVTSHDVSRAENLREFRLSKG